MFGCVKRLADDEMCKKVKMICSLLKKNISIFPAYTHSLSTDYTKVSIQLIF